MKKQIIYGVLAIAGICLTWYHNIQFAIENGSMNMGDFIAACFVNHAAGSIAWDVTIAAITFLTWSNIECKRLQMQKIWWGILVITCGGALACGFPLFLLLRERRLLSLKTA